MSITSFLSSLMSKRRASTRTGDQSIFTPTPNKPLPDRTARYPLLYEGAPLEVLSTKNEVLFYGRLVSFNPHELHLNRMPGTIILPELSAGTAVHIRGCTHELEPFEMEATVKTSTKLDFKVVDIEPVATEYQRDSYRQPVNAPAEVYQPDDKHMNHPEPCILVNIGLNGACIASKQHYELNQVVRLRVELFKNAGHMSFISQVIRAGPCINGEREYGLIFEQMPKAKSRDLVQDIKNLQRLIQRQASI